MLKVLINAYACSPDMGSEPGMAWHWCVNLAKHCELHIITEGEFQEKIEAALPTLPQGKNMHFYYNPVPQKVRDMCWNQGDWRFYWYYRKWQKRTLLIAQKICKEQQIDIIHQLNMIGYREPGLLWKIKGPRYVWGPFGGLTMLPTAYLRGAGWKQRVFCQLKNVINTLQYRYQPSVRAAVRHADVLIAATSEAQRRMENYYHKKVFLINETGCEVADGMPEESQDSRFRLLWVGKFDFRKQLGIALEVVDKLQPNEIELHICGSGTTEQTQALETKVKELGIERRVTLHGSVSHKEVLRLMQTSDLLLFTSISEGTPHTVLEAIANRLPVVCFDCCGQGDVVTNEIGRKIPLTTPKESASVMAQAIEDLYNHRDALSQLSHNCIAASRRMSWEKRTLELTDIYSQLPPPFEIAWVGRFIFTKQLGMALRIVASLKQLNIRLHIVGTGEYANEYQQQAIGLGIDDICVWHGQVKHDEVNRIMQNSDLFLFTSIMEATSTVVLEAIQNGLPVLCFDACGMSAVVDKNIGVKIPLSTPEQSVKDFSEQIEYLYRHKEILSQLSANCRQRAEELSWESKAMKMAECYNQIVADNHIDK